MFAVRQRAAGVAAPVAQPAPAPPPAFPAAVRPRAARAARAPQETAARVRAAQRTARRVTALRDGKISLARFNAYQASAGLPRITVEDLTTLRGEIPAEFIRAAAPVQAPTAEAIRVTLGRKRGPPERVHRVEVAQYTPQGEPAAFRVHIRKPPEERQQVKPANPAQAEERRFTIRDVAPAEEPADEVHQVENAFYDVGRPEKFNIRDLARDEVHQVEHDYYDRGTPAQYVIRMLEVLERIADEVQEQKDAEEEQGEEDGDGEEQVIPDPIAIERTRFRNTLARVNGDPNLQEGILPTEHGPGWHYSFPLNATGTRRLHALYRRFRDGEMSNEEIAEASTRLFAMFAIEGVTRLLLEWQQSRREGNPYILINFEVTRDLSSGIGRANQSFDTRSIRIGREYGTNADTIYDRVMEILGWNLVEAAGSDGAEYIEGGFVLPSAIDFLAFTDQDGATLCGQTRIIQTIHPESKHTATLLNVKNRIQGHCLLAVVLSITGYKSNVRGFSTGKLSAEIESRGGAGPTEDGYGIATVSTLEEITGFRLPVILVVVPVVGRRARGEGDCPVFEGNLYEGAEGLRGIVGVYTGLAYDAAGKHWYGYGCEKPARPRAAHDHDAAEPDAEPAELPAATVAVSDKKRRASASAARKKSATYDMGVISYDFETVTDGTGKTLVYAVSAFFNERGDSLEGLPSSLAEWEELGGGVALYRAASTSQEIERGDVLSAFIRWVLNIGNTKLGARCRGICLSAFNGSKFDALILLSGLIDRGALIPCPPVIAGTKLLRLDVATTVPIFSHDPAQIVPGSLAAICACYKISRAKVGGFSHELPQSAYVAATWPEFLRTSRETLREYSIFDTLALAELSAKVGQEFTALAERAGLPGYNWRRTLTTAGIAEDFATSVMKASGYTMPAAMASLALENWVRAASTAGRTQVIHRATYEAAGPVAGEREPVVNLEAGGVFIDRVSSYPTSMRYESFPVGQYLETSVEVAGKLGVYNARIFKQPALTVLPRRSSAVGVPLDWTYTGQQNVVINSVDLKALRDAGALVEVGSGIYWEESAPIFAGFIDLLYSIKALEDSKPAAQRNEARRNLSKLLMNGFSGKASQKVRDSQTCLLSRAGDVVGLLEKLEACARVNLLGSGKRGQILISGKLLPECFESRYNLALSRSEAGKKNGARPGYLAGFIYAHARHALRTVLSFGGLYCDTDSALLPRPCYDEFRAQHPELITPPGVLKRLGDWEVEAEASNMRAYLIAPKTYALFDRSEAAAQADPGAVLKYRLKGVGARDVVVSDAEHAEVTALNDSGRAAWMAARTSLRDLSAADAVSLYSTWATDKPARFIGSSFSRGVGRAVEISHTIRTIAPPRRLIAV